MKISNHEPSKFLQYDGITPTPYFMENSTLGKLIPFSVFKYVEPATSRAYDEHRDGLIPVYLKDIKYSKNEVVLHKDSSVMPKNIKCWASWVYKKTEEDKPILSYWMNSLQDIDKKYPIFVSLNPENYIDNDKVFNKHILEHPIFDMSARKAQKQMPSIQGINNSFFCGAYNKYGFHEDGVVSSIEVVEKSKKIDI